MPAYKRQSRLKPASYQFQKIMLLIKSSNRLWDHILSFNPTHLSILTYGVQRTVGGHSGRLMGLLREEKTRIIVCPNSGPIPLYLKYRPTDDCHTKFILSHGGVEKFWVTSMNLEVGLWENFLYDVEDKKVQKQMLTHFNTKWSSCEEPEELPTYDHLLKK